jgi:ATPase family AAA domain-containing protein 3A/B
VDEAEAFLARRGSLSPASPSDTHIRNALNALLYQTGKASTNFMLVLATNHPQDLDPAILDRVDVSLQIPYPLLAQRLELSGLYLRLYVQRVADQSQRRGRWRWTRGNEGRWVVSEECGSEKTLAGIAARTEGFSGREIAKLFIAVQYAMVNAEKGVLTGDLLQEVVDTKLRDHGVKSGGFLPSSSVESSSKTSINKNAYFEETNPMLMNGNNSDIPQLLPRKAASTTVRKRSSLK